MTEELKVSLVMTCAGSVHRMLIEAANTIIKAGVGESELLTMLVLIGDDIIAGLMEAWKCSHEEALKRYTELLRDYNELSNIDKNKN